jgi:integrase
MPRPNTGPRLKPPGKRPYYYIAWFEGGRERLRSTGTADGGEAEAAFARFLSERQRERGREPRHTGAVFISEVLDLYGSEHAPTRADPQRIGYAIAALMSFWEGKKVADITKRSCRDYRRLRGVSDGTLRRELGTLTAALNFAAGEKLIRKDQVPLVELPEKPEGKDRWLLRGEAAALLNAARTARGDVRLYLPLFVMLGLYTGARKTAILTLRWPQVDLEKRRINFAKGARKSNKGRAHIPIPDRLMPFLRSAWRRRMSDVGFVIHDAGRPIKDIGGAWDGNEAKDAPIQGSFGRACRRAGLLGVSPHTLRHTCGTWMAQSGVDLWKIAGWLGQSYATTVELYAHHHPDFLDEAKQSADRRR